MKFYGVVQLRFDDDSWVKEYAQNVTPILERRGRYLARTQTMEKIEGDRELPTLFVIVEWPSRGHSMSFLPIPNIKNSSI